MSTRMVRKITTRQNELGVLVKSQESVFHPMSCAKPNLEIKTSIYAPQNTFYELYKSVKWDHGGKNGLDEHIDVVF